MASSSTSTHASTYDSTKSTRVSVVAVRLAVLNRVCDRQDWFAFYFSYFVGHFGWTTDEAACSNVCVKLCLSILPSNKEKIGSWKTHAKTSSRLQAQGKFHFGKSMHP